jgi:hypothetical protein
MPDDGHPLGILIWTNRAGAPISKRPDVGMAQRTEPNNELRD